MARTRMTRQELKAQDEITTTLHKFTGFVYARKNQILAAVVAVAVGVAIVLGWNLYAANRNASAQQQLSAAITIFEDSGSIPSDTERYQETIAEAQRVVDSYGSLPAGAMAQYYIALSHERLGDTDQAIELLTEVAARLDSRISDVAQFALASIYSKQGEHEKAVPIYNQLYESGGYSKAAVGFELGKLHEASNQPEQAKEYYETLTSEFPESPFRQAADNALRNLDVTASSPADQ